VSAEGQEESSSFLKKRTKKLLFLWLRASRIGRHDQLTKRIKVFCFFFSKKKYFLASLVLHVRHRLPALHA
jgi:hypothetical protein